MLHDTVEKRGYLEKSLGDTTRYRFAIAGKPAYIIYSGVKVQKLSTPEDIFLHI